VRLDAHLHFWRPANGFDIKPVAELPAMRRDFLPGDVAPQCAASDIDRVILVQAAPQEADTLWLLTLARDYELVAGVTGWVDLDVDALDVAALCREPKLLGVRAQLRRHPDSAFIARPRVQRNVARLLDAQLSVTILAEPRHYRHVAEMLDPLPPGPIIINHLGLPALAPDRGDWRDSMREFAGHRRVVTQLSGLPEFFGDRWRQPEVLSLLDDALDIFGPRRLLFASDWPMIVPYASYPEWVETVEAFGQRRGLSSEEVEAIFGGNALRAHPRLAALEPGQTPVSPDASAG
jgi:L-fuconolactonase